MDENVELCKWLDNHYISYRLRHDIMLIPEFGKAFIQADYKTIFNRDRDGNVNFKCIENVEFLKADDVYYVVFPFGDRWFYVDIRKSLSDVQFKVLRYVGKKPVFEHKCEYCPLGIHTGYELLNGSGLLNDWCEKVKFLGYNGIGIADRNTLAASLDLQTSATALSLPFVFGYSTTMTHGSDKINIIIYCNTQEGFQNLLRIQKAVGVDSDDGTISSIDVLNHADGNILVFEKRTGKWLAENKDKLDDFIKAFDGWVYFQVDLSEYKADRIDSDVLLSIKAYFDAFSLGNLEYDLNIRPVLIQDVYYLDKEDWKSKILLNKIDIGAAHEQSDDQYLKTIDELYSDFRGVFSDKYGDDVFYDMCDATMEIAGNAVAKYDLDANYAPQYEMTADEQRKYGSNLNMFRQIIEDGFVRLVPEGMDDVYRERVEYEKYIIESTNTVDYFLIQYDTVRWAERNGILVGLGRGSAGGSLLLYLMGITQIDPIKYGLIFERFLLPERAGLESEQVTTIAKEMIDSNDYVEITLDNGKTYKIDQDSTLRIERDGVLMDVYADELLSGDEIIFDNHVVLWDL